ncbi:MAG: methyl-accepting chemotaxis protein [Gammaproteobacteria bacterium]
MLSGNKDIVKNSQQAIYVKYVVLMIVLLVCAAAVFLMSYTSQALQAKYLSHVAELRVLSQQIVINATKAAKAATGASANDAFTRLDESRFGFEARWRKIRAGDHDEGLSPSSDYVKKNEQVIEELQVLWQKVSQNADRILSNQEKVVAMRGLVQNLNTLVPNMKDQFQSVADTLTQIGAPARQVILAERQVLLAERIVNSVNRILEDGNASVSAAELFERDVKRFGRVLNAMQAGDTNLGIEAVRNSKVAKKLAKIADDFGGVNASMDQILKYAPDLFQVRTASDQIFKDSQQVLEKATALSDSLSRTYGGFITNAVALGFGLAAVLVLVLMLSAANRQTRRLLEAEAQVRAEEEQANQRNQQAILRLLDEMGDLADGDLTVATTVSEDFTGAIADSINFTIDQLRSLVSTINETAVKVTSAAQEAQGTAHNLAEASDHQAQEIAGASAAVNQMAMSIDQVSANALESSSVAERSVEIANKGADVVRATINGMDTIREQIQETSKRIKRLGESSQEIGDIVSLINDIADQTNILALNAAIQASMAGDAGRGFAVVADEVQRLAEMASNATKQIEALVRTIQNDTNEAVISMEQTTAQVVNGARLAQDAGVALGEIETVSKSLADLIQSISNAARQQAASAGQISKTMSVIQEITSQTSEGTTVTASSIGHLAELAVQMRNSVAGFKLPDQQMG